MSQVDLSGELKEAQDTLERILKEENFLEKLKRLQLKENNMMKPLGEWVLTKQVDIKEKKKESLIIIPESAKEDKQKSKYVQVIDMGPDVECGESLKKGSIVIVPFMTGLKFKHQDVEYEMAKVENFMCVLENMVKVDD